MHIKLLFVAFLIAGFTLPVDNPLAQSSTTDDSFKTEMLNLVNQIRSEGCQCGKRYMPPAPPLQWNPSLEKAAIIHAKDMNTNKFIGHKGSDGSKIGERIDQAGYNWEAVGENVSWGSRTVKGAVNGWKESPSHCITMMSASYQEMGAANDGKFWVQDFGRQMK